LISYPLPELDPEIGDKVHVSVARLKKDKRLNLTAVGEIERVRRYKDTLIGNQLSRQMIEEFLKRLESESPSEADIKLLLLDAFFAELFFASARRQKDYKATSALSDIIFSMEKIDGFAYPSVAHHGGINFAIRAESFSESVEIIRCMSLRITNYLGFGIYGRLVFARSS
jgi:hypothetical protein